MAVCSPASGWWADVPLGVRVRGLGSSRDEEEPGQDGHRPLLWASRARLCLRHQGVDAGQASEEAPLRGGGMMLKMVLWWHRRQGHEVRESRVTVPLFDMSKGYLYRCSCGKVWAT